MSFQVVDYCTVPGRAEVNPRNMIIWTPEMDVSDSSCHVREVDGRRELGLQIDSVADLI